MAFTWNRFAYTNFHELNLDWFNEHFKEIFEEWEELYNTLTQWKIDTDADLAQWKEDALVDMDTWERELLAALDEWKIDTGDDIHEWEDAIVSELDDWKERFLIQYEDIYNRVDSIVSDTEDMVENLADPFSTSTNYSAKDYVIYNGLLYKFTADHSAGAWIGTDAEQVTAMDEVKTGFIANRSGTIITEPLAYYRFVDDGLSVVDFNTMPLNTYAYATWTAFKTALVSAGFPLTWSDSDYVCMMRLAITRSDSNNSIIKLYNFTNTECAEMLYYATTSSNKYRWVLPSTDLTKQYFPADSKTVGDALALKQDISTLVNGRTNVTLNPWGGIGRASIGDTIDFRSFPVNTCCFTTYNYIKAGFADTNMPDTDWEDADYVVLRRQQISYSPTVQNSIVTIFNFSKTRKLEMLYFATTAGEKYRWLTQNGSVNYNTFENTINQYSNSYSVTANPSITTDANNYLQPTGDTTDMSTAIETMLTQTGICNLAPGTFYVSGVDMPANSTIRGSGNATNIILLDSVTNGYAIKMGTRCAIDSVQISGGASTPAITSNIGNRNGIVWQGTAIPGGSVESNGPARGMITNCHIRYFTGSGIYCYGTGTNISNCLNVANVFIYDCTAGVNVAWLSEYHRFSNIDIRGCYYGIINNGGNNSFSNCGFSKNMICLLMDNTYGQSYNNSHGSFNNCVFNHSGASNNGVAIQIIGCTNGEIFTGCQIFYGDTIITESEGIVFANCNFGGATGTQITITNGGLIMYDGCCFKNAPTVTKIGNTTTKMINCYLRDGTAVTIS